MIFAGAVLDRAPLERTRPEWLAEQRADPRARAILLSERGIWLDGAGLLLARPSAQAILLGLSGETPLFADDVSGAEPAEGRPAGLREAATELSVEEIALAGYAGSLLAWHRRHRFCANCGRTTEQRDGGHERHCPACDAHHFPGTDPVVIVRVTDAEDRLLLGRQARWADGRFSLLAGYVEPGETLEEAVRREVLEESGVALGEVRTWPRSRGRSPVRSCSASAHSPPAENRCLRTASSRRCAGSTARRWSGRPVERASLRSRPRTRSRAG